MLVVSELKAYIAHLPKTMTKHAWQIDVEFHWLIRQLAMLTSEFVKSLLCQAVLFISIMPSHHHVNTRKYSKFKDSTFSVLVADCFCQHPEVLATLGRNINYITTELVL